MARTSPGDDTTPLGRGWVVDSVVGSMRTGVLEGLAVWQLIVAAAASVSAVTVPVAAVVGLHVLVALLSVWSARTGRSALPVLGLVYAGFAVDVAVLAGPTGPLALAALWTAILTIATPVLVLRGRVLVVIVPGVAAVLAAVVLLVRPEWPGGVVTTLVVIGTANALGGAVLVRDLFAFARAADGEEAAEEQERARLEQARRAGREAVEDARTLHDTVVNTLAAVAAGGPAVRDASLVRERCARDATVLASILAGRRDAVRWDLDAHGLVLHQAGLDPQARHRHAALLDPAVVRAVEGAVDEALRNVAEHAGVQAATLDVRLESGSLVVRVVDHGRGLPAGHTDGLGLRESVRGRCAEVGVDVDVRATPGGGTTVELRCPDPGVLLPAGTDPAGADPAGADPAPRPVRGLQRHGCWVWARAILGATVLAELATDGSRPAWSFAMIAVVAVGIGVAWLTTRSGGDLPTGATVLLVGLVPLGLVLEVVAAGSGRDDVSGWQAVALTPLLMALLALRSERRSLGVAMLLLVLTGVATAGAVGWGQVEVMASVVVAALIQLGLFAGCQSFHDSLDDVGRRLAAAHDRTAATRRESVARDAVTAARERWDTDALHAALVLLRGLGDATLRVDDPAVRERCSAVELDVRQHLMLTHESVHLAGWFALALAEARARDLRLTLRTAGGDAPDERTARSLGRAVVHLLDAVEVGTDLTVSLFADASARRLMVVGPADLADAPLPEPPPGWTATSHRFTGQSLVEIEGPLVA
ncbi:MAG: hypothetical protein PGN07_01820 [Aeromicrobium erythreum]